MSARSVCLSLSLVLLLCGQLTAQPTTATGVAKASWGGDVDGPGSTTGFAPANGSYTLGTNTATVTATVTKPAITKLYSAGGADNSASTSGGTLATTKADAFSFMTVNPIDANKSYPYDMFVKATVVIGGFGLTGPGGSASASGVDPQYISSPGLLVGSLTLGCGSTIYAARPGVDFAESTFQISAPLLSSPLASIVMEAVNGTVDATVQFARRPI